MPSGCAKATLDRKEDLETEKLRLEIEKMSPAQIAEKVIKEAEEELEAERPRLPSTSPARSLALDYFRIEEAVVNKLVNCFGKKNVLANSRIRDRGYDVILLSNKPNEDTIFEIKGTARGFNRTVIQHAADRLVRGIEVYAETTGRKANGVGLFMHIGNKSQGSDIHERHNQIAAEIIKANNANVRLYFLTEGAWTNLSCGDLGAMIYPPK